MGSFRFYLITNRQQTRHDPLVLLPALAEAGLRALQIREKDLPLPALTTYCRSIQHALAASGGSTDIYLNHEAELARELGLAGVHLRESSLPLSEQPPALREALRWGVSTHNLAGARRAEAAGADFVTFGPVYETPSKAAMGDPVGLAALEAVTRAVRIPVLALGGITPERCGDCLAAGASGVAAIGAIWNAPDPIAALLAFQKALGGL